jgi:hypothetical protein
MESNKTSVHRSLTTFKRDQKNIFMTQKASERLYYHPKNSPNNYFVFRKPLQLVIICIYHFHGGTKSQRLG